MKTIPSIIIALLLLFSAAQFAGATVRTVTNLNDSGAGSLREAMATSAAGDTIDFINTLTGTILLASNLPAIGTNLTIINTNVQSVTIWGNAHSTFNIGGGSVTLSGLVIRNGNSSGNIWNSGTATINDCVIADAYLASGIFNLGSMSINRCLITNNIGGIYNQGSSLTINGSTISDNNAGTAGSSGGIYTVQKLLMTNCTVSRNHSFPVSGGQGGGIGGGGIITLNSCTICSNSVGGTAGIGGGLYAGVPTVVVNTLIAGNTATGSGPDVHGTVTSQGYNFIGITNDSSGWIASDLKGSAITPIDPKLGPLRDNGGRTFTHALLAASPAIDAGNSAGLALDQRGRQRPYDLSYRTNVAGGDGNDIGAFELNPPILSIAQSGTNAVIFWSKDDSGYSLQSATNIAPAVWSTNLPAPVVVSGQNAVTNAISSPQKFYRLSQ